VKPHDEKTGTTTAEPESPASAAARLLARARWAKTKPEEKAAFMKRVRALRKPGQMGGAERDPEKPRCPCGVMTLKRAKARAHHCEPPLKAQPGRMKPR
jgi:hypothetical protein